MMIQKTLLFIFLCVSGFVQAQLDSASLPEYRVKGLIRVNTGEVGYTNRSSGVRTAISFRRFEVDSVAELQFFGWHYSGLKPYIEDHQPSLKAFNTANVFVSSQQICILGLITSGTIYALTKTTGPQPVLTGAIIGFSSGILLSHIGKRISINTCMRKHNRKILGS